jgi:hypothetical protein
MTDKEMLSGEFEYLLSLNKALWTCAGITLNLLVRSGALDRTDIVNGLAGAINSAEDKGVPGIDMLISLKDQLAGTF